MRTKLLDQSRDNSRRINPPVFALYLLLFLMTVSSSANERTPKIIGGEVAEATAIPSKEDTHQPELTTPLDNEVATIALSEESLEDYTEEDYGQKILVRPKADPEPPPPEQIDPPVPPDPLTFLRGLQGQFETDLFTGSANFSYPLWIPAGRNGVQPALGLTYSSSNTSLGSVIGYGWSLPISGIYRSTSRGVDRLYVENDFSVEIFGNYYQLISVNAADGEYGARIESGTFSKYIYKADSWTMIDAHGTVYTFGSSSSTRQVDPNNSNRIYKWMLEKVEDTNGNHMTFTYSTDAGQVYPETVRYTGHGTDQGLYEIRFLRTPSANPTVSYRTGFKVETNHVIASIEVYSYHTGSPTLARTYECTYEENQHAFNLLESVTIKGGALSLPPIQFEYYNGTAAHGLLKKITFPTGGTQEINYKPSTAYRNEAQGPANANLPFIIQTVHSSVQQASATDPAYASVYEYAGGHYYFDPMDAYTREYAGFREVKRIDPIGNIYKLYFHQSEFSKDNAESAIIGEFEDHIAKKGRAFREEFFDNSGNLYQLTIRKWDKESLPSDHPNWSRYFPKLVRETIAHYDGGSDYRATASEFSYDHYGSVTQEIQYGEVTLVGNDGSFIDTGDDRLTKSTEYAENLSDYIVSLPKKEQLRDQDDILIGETKRYYDGSDTLGNLIIGNLTKIETLVDATGVYITTRSTYNAYGLPTTTTNPRNYTTITAYGAHNLFPATVTNARSQTTTYDAFDYFFAVPQEVTDPNGLKAITLLDALGRVVETQVTDPLTTAQEATVAIYSYDTDNFPNRVTVNTVFDHTATVPGQGEYEVLTYFDGFGRPIQTRAEAESDGQYIRTSVIYDALGNVKKELLPVFATGAAFEPVNPDDLGTAYQYDALNRVTSVTNPVGTTTTVYTQWEQRITDANGHLRDRVFDARENLVEIREYFQGAAHSTAYDYDGLNNLVRITDAEGNLRNMQYDLLGRRTSMEDLHTSSDPTFGVWTFTYDENGNLSSKVDPKGQAVSYSYDELDRVLTEDFLGSDGVEVAYTYDIGTNAVGRLSSVSSSFGRKSFGYDLLGRRIRENYLLVGTPYVTTYSYDLAGNLTNITYPDDMQVDYIYNGAGKLQSINSDGLSVVTNLDYSPHGQIARLDYANGVSTVNTYDVSQVYRLTDKKTSRGGANLQDISYSFDPVGNITQVVEKANTDASRMITYTYDDLDRLTSATATNTGNDQDFARSYTYDLLGNILTKSDVGAYVYAGGDAATSIGTLANPHAVTNAGGVLYSYDENGNLTSNGAWQHVWDYQNRLVSSSDGIVAVEYGYDENGQRVSKLNTTTGKITLYPNKYFNIEDLTHKNFIYAGEVKVATVQGGYDNTVFIFGDGFESGDVSAWSSSTAKTSIQDRSVGAHALIYHHLDHLGSGSVDTDESGQIVQLLEYYPFGAPRIDTAATGAENDFKFTGKELDEDTDLYYYEARYYDAWIGRFVSADPWNGDLADPQSLNKYAYVRNNPLRLSDPAGRSFKNVVDKIVEVFQFASKPFEAPVAAGYELVDSLSYDSLPDIKYENVSIFGQFGGKFGNKVAQVSNLAETIGGTQMMSASGPLMVTCPATAGSGCGASALTGAAGMAMSAHGMSNLPVALKKARKIELEKRIGEHLRGIRSKERRIEEHLKKINDPGRYVKNYGQLSKQHQQGLLDHWRREVRTFRSNIAKDKEAIRSIKRQLKSIS